MEESVNFVNGYGKVNPSDEESTTDPSYSPSTNRRNTVAAVVTLGIFVIIIGSILGAAEVHRRSNKPSLTEPRSSSIKAQNSIKFVCAVTQHPKSCIADVSSINSGNFFDPELIFNFTLRLAINELANISSLPKTLISKSHDLNTGAALRDCATLFDDALSQLSKTVEAMCVGRVTGMLLTEEKVADMKTWISAAMTDQETCVDGLEEMGSTAVEEVKVRMQKSTEYMSNSLAILDNIQTILDHFGLRLH